jgi:hypothetical protein
VLWLTVREHAAAAGQYRRDMLELLVTAAPNRIPRLEELSAYDLGTDPEAVAAGGPTPYLLRDKDDELDAAIVRAARAHDPSMVVLRGPSKSGKSAASFDSSTAAPTGLAEDLVPLFADPEVAAVMRGQAEGVNAALDPDSIRLSVSA